MSNGEILDLAGLVNGKGNDDVGSLKVARATVSAIQTNSLVTLNMRGSTITGVTAYEHMALAVGDVVDVLLDGPAPRIIGITSPPMTPPHYGTFAYVGNPGVNVSTLAFRHDIIRRNVPPCDIFVTMTFTQGFSGVDNDLQYAVSVNSEDVNAMPSPRQLSAQFAHHNRAAKWSMVTIAGRKRTNVVTSELSVGLLFIQSQNTNHYIEGGYEVRFIPY